MKKLLALLFIIVLSFALWACGSTTCTEHVDADGDLKCDTCQVALPCTDHVDNTTDGSYKCDKCGAAMTCTDHVDEDANLKCDECSKKLTCKNHVDADKDGECDKCFATLPCENHTDDDVDYVCDRCSMDIDCTGHTDSNNDNVCDKCDSKIPCSEHVDANEDLKCDKCEAAVPCTSHKDNNRDLKCDKCQADVECTHVDANNDGICDVEKCKWNYDHEHTYNTSWSSDADKHWHAPSCDHTIANKDEAAHIDESNDGICDVCQYVMCTHSELDTESEEWRRNDKGHWRPLKCGHNAEPDASLITPHTFDNGTDGVCVCGYEKAHVHTFETEWTITENEHWHKSTCGCEVEVSGKGSHTDVTEYDGKCDVCDYVMCNCAYDEENWYTDETKHWHQAIEGCDHLPIKDEGEHVDTLDNNGICDTCGYVLCEHPFTWISTENGHEKRFECTHILSTEAGDHVDADKDIVCDVCGYNWGHEHEFSNAWSSDATHHWHEVIGDCATEGHNVKDAYAEHTDVNGDFECDICEEAFENKAPSLDDDDDTIETPKMTNP